ncbi:diguanylate cyclase [Terasakiispira papahanaumokuakeensis]|uniref:diguanylate cyclase n=1 Tax=Terasakiispira papahanaumokuakeensis TaxID=197479 RepID=A0A1E2VBZ7_9GAMM|nr:diguanylate cyclase [Terasakiispira papahanaumokuakeensis]ODC04483.1 diguanylate cyclase [Terasakiispira papahanaumokuakeensis]
MRGLLNRLAPFFVLPLALVGIALLLLQWQQWPQALLDIISFLPWLIGLAGSVLSLVYDRIRNLFLIGVLLSIYALLMPHVDFILYHKGIKPSTQLVFVLLSLLMPVTFLLFAIWRERFHAIQDIILRLTAAGLLVLVIYALASKYPEPLLNLLTANLWSLSQSPWLPLPQLSMLAFMIAFIGLMVQCITHNQPHYAAQLVAMTALFWTLPHIFSQPEALPLMTTAALTMLSTAIVHESFHMAFLDELTGLPGRRALNEKLQRLGRRYTLAMTDVDHFKKFNDTYGHDVGDQVLRMVASRLSRVTGGGKAYRYGGEEFTLVFPGKTVEQCLPHLESVRESIEHYAMRLRDKKQRPEDDKAGKEKRTQQKKANSSGTVSVTISIGVSERTERLKTPEEVIKSADEALYDAKGAGRNCVVAYNQPSSHRRSTKSKKPPNTTA